MTGSTGSDAVAAGGEMTGSAGSDAVTDAGSALFEQNIAGGRGGIGGGALWWN